MRISEIMRKDFLCIEPDDTLAAAAKKLAARGLSEAPVMGEGKFQGMLCTSDLAAALVRHDLLNSRLREDDAPKAGGEAVKKHIRSTRAWLAPEADILSALLLLVHHNTETLPVLNKAGRVVGVVRGDDLRREMLKMFAGSKKAQEAAKKAPARGAEASVKGTTAIDQLVQFVRQSGTVSAPEAAKRCNLTVEEVESYALSLEKNGLLKIDYDMLGNMKLQKHI
ncbi:MAG: CBS domain-containing protein [Candidatus Micrarchaeia archaeon]|jgi:CBS domain-containing protein